MIDLTKALTDQYCSILNEYINKYALYGAEADKPTMEEVKAMAFVLGFVEKVMETAKEQP